MAPRRSAGRLSSEPEVEAEAETVAQAVASSEVTECVCALALVGDDVTSRERASCVVRRAVRADPSAPIDNEQRRSVCWSYVICLVSLGRVTCSTNCITHRGMLICCNHVINAKPLQL
jgi:hypothetical protein